MDSFCLHFVILEIFQISCIVKIENRDIFKGHMQRVLEGVSVI